MSRQTVNVTLTAEEKQEFLITVKWLNDCYHIHEKQSTLLKLCMESLNRARKAGKMPALPLECLTRADVSDQRNLTATADAGPVVRQSEKPKEKKDKKRKAA